MGGLAAKPALDRLLQRCLNGEEITGEGIG